jgi:predicted acetyltransferase
MTTLATPDARFHRSWAEAVAEFADDGSQMHGSGLWEFDELDTTEAGCRAIAARLAELGDPAYELPDGKVHSSYFWIVEGEEFVGYLALRHTLNDWLLNEGGHIGFSVRPSRRRQGYAAKALALALPEAAALGLDRVLLTCDEDNTASARTIETNGGVYEDSRKGKRRYWIALG